MARNVRKTPDKKHADARPADKLHRVLVVDNDESSIDAIKSVLADECDVVTATGGREALDLIDGMDNPEEIHLIISDCKMLHMTGIEFLAATAAIMPKTIRIILTGNTELDDIISAINDGQVNRYVLKPISPRDLQATVRNAIDVYELEQENARIINELTATNTALQKALKNLHLTKITNGVFWLQIPEADLYILCGSPADVVKHMMRKGFVTETHTGEISFESGPNAILLSDSLLQKGEFCNLAEFPVLQMMYRQGMSIPSHPNNKGVKPILIGAEQQVTSQMEYIHRGNYGLVSLQEIIDSGVSRKEAEAMMRVKLNFAFGKIDKSEELLDSCIVDQDLTQIRNGVSVRRVDFNQYEFHHRDKAVTVDLNLAPDEIYEAPYELGFHQITREFFAVVHTGEGDGWDTRRPCMASILMYKGDIYLIDTGPGIPHILLMLGIDVSEIKGIFHTHGHDDHFAGLPGLMRGDHQIKYYATAPVRAAVSKKLSALMSMDEALFYEYFDVCDLKADKWNDIDGLEVKPIYSPHPVETNIFLFQTQGEDGYRSYAHWADLTSFEVLESMIEEDDSKPGVTREFYDTTRANYLIPADIKKVDIGGGMIHGQIQDFAEDRSGRIILAHRSDPLTAKEREVGSDASFATMDILITKQEDYLQSRAAEYLHEYFPKLPMNEMASLLNSPIESVNPGTIVLEKGARPDCVYLVLSGTMECIQSELNIKFHMSTGSFIGDLPCLNNTRSVAAYRSVSHVQLLHVTDKLYRSFLVSNNLLDQVLSVQQNIELLRTTWLFGEELSYLVQNKIAQSMVPIDVEEDEELSIEGKSGLFLIDDGELNVKNSQGEIVEVLNFGDFFGEQSLLSDEAFSDTIQASFPSRLFFIDASVLAGIPVVHLKLSEIWATRRSR
jgi:hemerythrin|tara:strand:+ start:9333 stop:12029 length:2697 start_codon:yes stop_codon:yes gene_type:complete